MTDANQTATDPISGLPPGAPADLIEWCLLILHGRGDYGWRLLKQTWPTSAVEGQYRLMAEIVEEVRKAVTNDRR